MALAEVKAAGIMARLTAEVMGWLIMAVIIVACGLAFWGQQRQIAALKAERTAVTATGTADHTARRAQVTYIREKEVRDVEIQDALDREPEFRDSVVPADVADRLRDGM